MKHLKRVIFILLALVAVRLSASAVSAPLAIDNLQAQGQQADLALQVHQVEGQLSLSIVDKAGKVASSATALRQDGRIPALVFLDDGSRLDIRYEGDGAGIPQEWYRFAYQQQTGNLAFETAMFLWPNSQIVVSSPNQDWLLLEEHQPRPLGSAGEAYVQMLKGLPHPGISPNQPILAFDADEIANIVLDYYKTWQSIARVQYFDRELERLKLRDRPDSGGKVLGQYFGGTVIDEVFGQEGEWTQVRIGNRVGYMMRKHLVMGGLIATWSPTQRFGGALGSVARYSTGTALYPHPDHNSQALAQLPPGTSLVVLATLEEDWLHVVYLQGYNLETQFEHPGEDFTSLPAVHGFVSARDVGMADNYSTCYVATKRPQDKLHLRAAPEAGAKSLGMYFYDTAFLRLFDDHVINDGFERVRLGDQVGYVKDSFLSYRSGGVADYLPPLSYVKKATGFYPLTGSSQPAGKSLAKGTVFQVLGTLGNYYHVRLSATWDGELGYVKQADVQKVNQAVPTQVRFANGALMYATDPDSGAYVPYADQRQYVDNLKDAKGWLSGYITPGQEYQGVEIQIQQGHWFSGFVVKTADIKFDKGLVWAAPGE